MPMTSDTIVTVCENGSVHQSRGSRQWPSPSVSRCMLRSIMREIAAFDIVHLRVRMPLPRSTHGLLTFRPLLVAFAAVARRAVDVVRLPLAMIRCPSKVSGLLVRLGGVLAHSAG